jgi:streptomycin 6-kinase
MSSAPDIPIPPALARRFSGSSPGRAWLASLPGLIRGRLEHWQLAVDLEPGQMPWNGHGGLVIPVLQSGSRTALKVAYPHDEARAERHALMLWNGHGAVRLVKSDAGTCSMLLERLEAGRSLLDAPMDVAVAVWGGLMAKLSLVPDLRPEWREFDHVAAQAERWTDDLPADWEQLGRPFPRWLLEAALEVCQTRGAVGRRAGKDVLVNTDFHFENVLGRPDSSAWEGPDDFAAIDPQPMIGEAEFAVAPLLWNRLHDLPRSDPGTALLQRCWDFSEAAGLDPESARQWGVAREVENALWFASRPAYGGDLARSLWVASTLAGKTLGGLPHPHDLPCPGQAFT